MTTLYCYGMELPDLSGVSEEKWNNLLQKAPNFLYLLDERMRGNGYRSIGEYENDWPGDILCEVINEAESLSLRLVHSSYPKATDFLVFVPDFPWEETDEEKKLTPQTLSAIFAKYTKMLMDEPPVVGFRTLFVEAEDGGSANF